MAEFYFLTSDNTIEVRGVKDQVTDTFDNDSTVTVQTLIDISDDSVIVGETWPLTLAYVAASNGIYRGNLVDTLVVSEHDNLEAEIRIDDGADRRLTIYLPVIVKKKTS